MWVVLTVAVMVAVVLLLLNLSYGGKEIRHEVAHLYGVADPQFVFKSSSAEASERARG
jgi:hypothetical protein